MSANEYGVWQNSVWNESPGGKHNSVDPYNKALKGKEYQTDEKEYYSSGMEEYHHYAERYDPRTTDSDDEQQQSERSRKSSDAKAQARRNLIKQVVGLVAGSTIIVSAYQARVESRAQQLPAEPAAIVETTPIEESVPEQAPQEEQLPTPDEPTPPDTGESGGKESSGDSAPSGGGRGGNGGGSRGGRNAANKANDQTEDDKTEDETEDETPEEDQTEDGKTEDGKTEDGKTEDGKTEDGKTEDGKTEDGKTEDGKTEDDKTEEQKPEEKKSEGRALPVLKGWTWNEDHTEASAVFADDSAVSATITYVDDVYCAKAGTRTYTATLKDKYGRIFTDKKTESLPATGHSYEEIGESVSGEIRYRCTVCGEEFAITYQITPES